MIFTTMDKHTNRLLGIKLEATDGSEIEVKEVVEEIYKYIIDELEPKTSNQLVDITYPLISNILIDAMPRVCTVENIRAIMITQPVLRELLTVHMMISYYFLKFIQKNNIKVISVFKELSSLSDEERVDIEKNNSLHAIFGEQAEEMKIKIDEWMAQHLPKVSSKNEN